MADSKSKAQPTKPVAAKASAPKVEAAQPAAKPAVKAAPIPVVTAPKAEPAAPAAILAQTSAIAQAAVQTTSETIQEGTSIMANETQKTAETGKIVADRFQAVIGDVNARAQGAVEKTAKLAEEMTDLTKGNVEALVASSKIVAKGAETLGQEVADYSRRSFEQASAALKSFAEVKSPTDFFKLQGDYARSAFDAMVAESSKVSEAVIKLAGEAAEPITSRYAVAAERVKTLAN
ncbi:MAG: phasin family protein [Pseudomonadota bacterium]|nr:phasin family protein [Pseudomonadota bacterium]